MCLNPQSLFLPGTTVLLASGLSRFVRSSSDMGRPSKTFPMADPAGDEPKRDSGRESKGFSEENPKRIQRPPKGFFSQCCKGHRKSNKIRKILEWHLSFFPRGH